MNAKDFFDLVAKMRGAQETFLSKRITTNLIRARELENMVDRELKKGLDPEPAQALPRSIQEALNEGDGVYRP